MTRSKLLILIVFSGLSFCHVESGSDDKILIRKDDKAILPVSVWKPTESNVTDAMLAIYKYLNDSTVKSSEYVAEGKKEILKESSNFRVQFECLIENDQKILKCYFIHKSASHSGWKDLAVRVDGGGWHYWRINFNVTSGLITGFSLNGPL